MSVYALNPLIDTRWAKFLGVHPDATVFHTPGWLDALRRTYGYEPVVYTTAGPGEMLTNGIVFCRISSWLTGFRVVSVPFSDHCQPLVENVENLDLLIRHLQRDLDRSNCKYIELRPLNTYDAYLGAAAGFAKSESFYLHKLDLKCDLDEIFRNFHKKSTQDKIHRAERKSLTYEEGINKAILAKFYHLQLLTRRRHQLPPQPSVWFRNLIECLGEKVKIRVLSEGDQPIASTLTLSYKCSVIAKYGCTDARYHHLGGMSLLL